MAIVIKGGLGQATNSSNEIGRVVTKTKYNSVSNKTAKELYKYQESQLKQLENKRQNLYNAAGTNISTNLNKNINLPKYTVQPSNANLSSNKNLPVETAMPTVEKYKNVASTPKMQNLNNDIAIQYNKSAEAEDYYSDVKADNKKISKIDKVFLPIAAGVGSLLPSKYKLKNENGDEYRIRNYAEKLFDKASSEYNSKFGKVYADITYNLGKIGGATLINAVTPWAGGSIGTAVYFADIFADNYNNTIQQGYGKDKAFDYAMISTATEAITEKILGGIGGAIGIGTSDTAKGISAKLTETMLKNHPRIANIIANAISEGSEEFVQEYLDNIYKSVLLENKELLNTVGNTILDPDVLKDALYSAFVGAASGGVIGGFDSNTYVKETYTDKNGKTKSRIVENLLNSDKVAINNNETDSNITDDNISNENDIKTANIDYNSNITQDIDLTSLDTEIEALKEKRYKTTNEKQIAELDTKISELQAQLDKTNEMIEQQNKDLPFEDTNRVVNTEQNKVNMPKIEPVTFEESAKFHNINPKTDEYKFANAIKNKLGVEVLFKNKVTDTNGQEVNGLFNPNTKTIELNINSGQTVQHLLTHELTHALEGTEAYQSLQNLVMDYSRATGGSLWTDALIDVANSYEYDTTTEGQKIKSEATAMILSDLINDQNFLNELAVSNPTIFTKLYAIVNELIARVTGNEKAYLRAVKAKMELAWKQASEGKIKQDGNIKYAIANDLTGIVSDKQQKRIKKAKEMYNQGFDINSIWKETGVIPSSDGVNYYYVGDLKVKQGTELIEGKKYKFGNELYGDVLDTYPQLKDKYVQYTNFENELKDELDFTQDELEELKNVVGATTTDNNVAINSKKVKTLDDFENVLSHEVQHLIQEINNPDKQKTIDIFRNKDISYNEKINSYRNSPTEMEAEIVRVLNSMTQKQRRRIGIKDITNELKGYYSKNDKKVNPQQFISYLENKYYNNSQGGGKFDSTISSKNESTKRSGGYVNKEGNESVSSDLSFGQYSIRKGFGKFKDFLIEESTSNIGANKESDTSNKNKKELDNSSFSLDKLPKLKEGYTRLYRGLNNEYDSNYDRSRLDSPNGYDTLTDNYELAKEYGKNVYYIDVPTNKLSNSVIDENPNSETYGDRNFVYKDDKPASINGISGNEYLLYSDHDEFNSNDYHKIEEIDVNSVKDNKGKTLSKEQQEYFKDSKVRDDNGNLMVMYHGTPNGEFTVFKPGSYFSNNQEYANGYQNENASSISYGKKVTTPKTYEVYLNITNPFTLQDANAKKIYIEEYIKGGNSGFYDPYTSTQDYYKQFEDNDIDWLEGEDLREWLKENHPEYDGLILDEGGDGGYGMAEYRWRGLSYMPFESNQIKDVNNTKPTLNEDINYSKNTNGAMDKFIEEKVKPINQNKAERTFEQIKLPKAKETNLPKIKSEDKTSRQDYLNGIENISLDDKAVNKIARNMKNTLSLSSKESEEFKRVLSEISSKKNITQDEIREIIDRRFSEKTYKERIDDVREIKRLLRNYKINVSDNIKMDIADYSDFRQRNYGKINFSKDGSAVDTAYQELSEMYPSYFSNDIKNPSDQLQEIAYVANMDNYLEKTGYLDDKTINDAAEFIFDSIEDYRLQEDVKAGKLSYEDYLKKTKLEDIKFRRKATILKNRELASEYLDNMANWKDTPLFKQKINTMKRNLRDIMPSKEADILYDEYFAPISKNNATIERETKRYNEKIEKLNLNKKESTAVQLLGELKYNPDTTLISEQVYNFINKNNLDEKKLNKAVDTFREVYDDLFAKVNEVLKENGYSTIGYKKGYFPHFTEEHGTNIIGKLAEKLGWKFNSQKLPTDIAGLTDTFSPGKKWVAFAQHRTGDVTDYNALKGFDNYVRGAMQVIYHTNDIQKLRGLENEIRYQHSEKGVQEKLDAIFNNNDLDTEERQNQIDSLLQGYNNNLGNFVTNLHEYTNNLAGKKSGLDRSVEFTMGRNIYNTMNNISSRVSANMVGLNLSSALTNFIPITQAWSQISTKNMMKAMKQTIANQINSDGFVENSDYLTNRIDQADKLYKTGLEKVSDKANVLFDAIDGFSSQVIVRGKYLENIQNGMNESEAMNNANEFAKDVMAGRSQGDKPTLFNSTSPITKLFTAFQLEVNNQYGYMFKDLPNDLKDKGMGLLIGAFIKMFLGAWLYNKMAEELTGRKSAFSPIDIVADSVETAQREDLSDYNKISSITKNVTDEAPFISGLLGGGRLPINSALPSISTLTENALNLRDESKKDKAIKNITKELEKPLFYVALPFGGGQLKKTKDAISMYNKSLPIAGSYTSSGNLRFEADTTAAGKAKALLFGSYSSKQAQDYVNSEFQAISSNRIQELKDLGMTTSEYRKYNRGLKNAGTKNSDKLNYIANSNYTTKQKNIMGNNVLKRTDFDVNQYKKCDSYEEYVYSRDYPEKYATIKQITSYDKYSKYKEEITKIRNNTTNDKEETIKYINSLNLSIPQKAMFIKQYYKSFNKYDSQIIQYINSQKISKKEKEEILIQLGFTIKDGRVYSK